jgi:hypothetical protein
MNYAGVKHIGCILIKAPAIFIAPCGPARLNSERLARFAKRGGKS